MPAAPERKGGNTHSDPVTYKASPRFPVQAIRKGKGFQEPKTADKNAHSRKRRRVVLRPPPEQAILYFIRNSRPSIGPKSWDFGRVEAAVLRLAGLSQIELEQQASALVSASLQDLAWQAVQCPKALEEAEVQRLRAAIEAEEQVCCKWRDDQSRLARLSSSLMLKQVTWLGAEERAETVKAEEGIARRYRCYLQREADWRQAVLGQQQAFLFTIEQAVATKALSLEEEQSRRCWSEELSVLAVPEKAQRAVFVDHLLRGMEEAAAALKRQLWAIVRREEASFWLMVKGALVVHESAQQAQLMRMAAEQATGWLDAARRVLAKEWAITSACEAELTRLTEAGAQELKRCSLWAELQAMAVVRSERAVHGLLRPCTTRQEEPRREREKTAELDHDAMRRYGKLSRELVLVSGGLEQPQRAFIRDMLSQHRRWYDRCIAEFERRMRLEAKRCNDAHVEAQTMARKIFAADQHSFRQSMQRALQDHKARFSFLALSRLMYLDEHSALQFRKWEGLRDRLRRESQEEAFRMKQAWDQYKQGMAKRLHADLTGLMAKGKRDEAGWLANRQAILRACITREQELQEGVGEHYGELEGAMERDLQEAMATLAQEGQGRPEDGEHLRDGLTGRWAQASQGAQAALQASLQGNVSGTLARLHDCFPPLLASYQAMRDGLPDIARREEEGLSAFLSEERGRMADFDDKSRSSFVSSLSGMAEADTQALQHEVRIAFDTTPTPQPQQQQQEGEDGGAAAPAFFVPCRIEARVLEQDSDEQSRLHMSYARLTGRRAERMVSLFDRRAALLAADLNGFRQFRLRLRQQRLQAVREALLAWQASTATTLESAQDRLRAEHAAFVSRIQAQLQVKLELDLDGFASMDSQLLAMAGAYLGFAVQAVSEQYKQAEQMRFGFERHTQHIQESYAAALSEKTREGEMLRRLDLRHRRHMSELLDYVAKQRQAWLAGLRTITTDVRGRADKALQAQETKAKDATSAALPGIRELQVLEERTESQEAQLGKYVSALGEGLRQASRAPYDALVKAAGEAEDRADKYIAKFESKDMPQAIRLAAAKAEHLTSLHEPEVESVVKKRNQELHVADAALMQKVTTFGEAVVKANTRFERDLRAQLGLLLNEKLQLLEDTGIASSNRIKSVDDRCLSCRFLPPGHTRIGLLNALRAHYEYRSTLLAALHEAADDQLTALLAVTLARLPRVASSLRRQEAAVATGLVLGSAAHWLSTQTVLRQLTRAVLHEELMEVGARQIDDSFSRLKELRALGREERQAILVDVQKAMDQRIEMTMAMCTHHQLSSMASMQASGSGLGEPRLASQQRRRSKEGADSSMSTSALASTQAAGEACANEEECAGEAAAAAVLDGGRAAQAAAVGKDGQASKADREASRSLPGA